MQTGPRILTLDIETAPALAEVWRLWDENVPLDRLLTPHRVICWAAKWLDGRGVMFASEYHDGADRMVDRIHELMMRADVLVHFNGARFDVPHLHREFMVRDLAPPEPSKEIDLLTVSKRAKFTSHKLDHLAQQLGLGAKLAHTGYQLWADCLRPEVDEQTRRRAWSLMRRYNKQDVRLTEDVYLRLRPWVKGHPHVALYDERNGKKVRACGRCGARDSFQRRGWYYTPTRAYRKLWCTSCGSWSREDGPERTVSAQPVS